MKPHTPNPRVEPSPPGEDPHPSTEEIGRAETPNTPQAPKIGAIWRWKRSSG